MNEFKADCSMYPDTDHLTVDYNSVLGQVQIYIKDDEAKEELSVFLSKDDSQALLKFLKENME